MTFLCWAQLLTAHLTHTSTERQLNSFVDFTSASLFHLLVPLVSFATNAQRRGKTSLANGLQGTRNEKTSQVCGLSPF